MLQTNNDDLRTIIDSFLVAGDSKFWGGDARMNLKSQLAPKGLSFYPSEFL